MWWIPKQTGNQGVISPGQRSETRLWIEAAKSSNIMVAGPTAGPPRLLMCPGNHGENREEQNVSKKTKQMLVWRGFLWACMFAWVELLQSYVPLCFVFIIHQLILFSIQRMAKDVILSSVCPSLPHSVLALTSRCLPISWGCVQFLTISLHPTQCQYYSMAVTARKAQF